MRHTWAVSDRVPAFARDAATAAYYEQRAKEYDEWYLAQGRFASRNPPGWHLEVARLVDLVGGLPAARTLDVACGTGFLTRHLRGITVGLDRSPAMVALAQSRLPAGVAIVGDALNLPVADAAFDRVLTGHFYGHLSLDERTVFLSEARRVAGELVVIDAALRPGAEPEEWQERMLSNGSRHRIYKRYLTSAQLAEELGGEVLFEGQRFVVARVTWSNPS
jgi:ubiquinone/menaquinone biosynthesis C-methylase UbiE